MYIAALPAEAATPATPMPSAPVPLPDGTPLPTSTSSTPPPDLSGSLATLPPIAGAAGPERTSFGSRYPAPTTATQGSDLGLRVTANDILPQPTVKPISRDIHVNETSDYIKTIKLVNIFQQGEVGLPRVGETIVMPNTNADVKLVESSASKIVLEENGTQFVWVPGDVGWVLKEPVGTAAQQDQSGLDISANKPADQSGGSGQSNSSGGTMGPEVPSNR
jgi:hypothetical protein